MKYSYACLDKRVAVTINIELFPPSHFLECKYLDPPHIKSKKANSELGKLKGSRRLNKKSGHVLVNILNF